MASSKHTDLLRSLPKSPVIKEEHIETAFLNKLSALMADLFPLLTKRADRRDISGLFAYAS